MDEKEILKKIGSKGGKSTLRKHGTKFYSEIGKKGNAVRNKKNEEN